MFYSKAFYSSTNIYILKCTIKRNVCTQKLLASDLPCKFAPLFKIIIFHIRMNYYYHLK